MVAGINAKTFSLPAVRAAFPCYLVRGAALWLPVGLPFLPHCGRSSTGQKKTVSYSPQAGTYFFVPARSPLAVRFQCFALVCVSLFGRLPLVAVACG
jgi:hypothetical protein